MKNSTIGLLVAGIKGLNFLKNFSQGKNIAFVASYPFKGLKFQPKDEIKSFCQENHYPYIDAKELTPAILDQADIVFVSGWQFLLKSDPGKTIILHDSLLPKFRGFAPTVNALICGESKIGVTAFKPAKEIDAGPIYEQIALEVIYPAKIKEIYSQLGSCYAKCATNIMERKQQGKLHCFPQNEAQASYSIWLGKEDLRIDWFQDGASICRLVDALGWPYHGAHTTYLKQEIIINEVEEILPKQRFELFHCGKIWKIDGNYPEVICQNGLIRILSAQTLNGDAVSFRKLRERLS